MLTKMRIRNFKRFEDVEIELGRSVVFIGPNNSGKTTALQALALWSVGLQKWNEKRLGKASPEKRPGVTINRRDLISIPVSVSNLLWRNMHVRNVERINGDKHKQRTQNIRVDVIVEGISAGKVWECGLEFDYANEESFFCRPLRLSEHAPNVQPDRMPVPSLASAIRVAYLPPMSGLADREFFKQQGEIEMLIGQGQTAQVLRNLCFKVYDKTPWLWKELTQNMKQLFGVSLREPQYNPERSEITMQYQDEHGITLDLMSAGRGLQQNLLLLAHIYANPRTVLLLDEPDAHLEILRQRQTYQLLTEAAANQDSQIVAASHSEVVLNEAADRDIVVAFVGRPHRIDDRSQSSQVAKALRDIGFDAYLQAEQTGWVLYLEGSTDLAILQAFAKSLGYDEAIKALERPFVHYIDSNNPQRARDHFFGLREAKPDLVGIAIFDRLDRKLPTNTPLQEVMWRRREIENYLCQRETLLDYAQGDDPQDLFAANAVETMTEVINDVTNALRVLGSDPWGEDIKASDEFLDRVFKLFYERMALPDLVRKSDYHRLARYVAPSAIDPEVREKLVV